MGELPTLLFLGSAFLAEVVGTMAGFGAATVLTPIAACFMDVKSAIAIVTWFHLCGNASRLLFFGRHLDWRVAATFGVAAIACGIPAAHLTSLLPSAVLSIGFGAFLLGYVALSLRAPDGIRWPRRPSTLVIGGAASGFIAGLLGTGGAIRSACLLAFGLAPAAYLGTSAAIALAVDATRLPVYLLGGLLPRELLPVTIGLIAVAFAGAWVGQRLVRRLTVAAFRRLVLGLLSVMGLRMVWVGFSTWP